MNIKSKPTLALILLVIHFGVLAQQNGAGPKTQVSGIFPDLALVAGHSPRTEAGIGAMVPWANRLWIVTYVAHMKRTGSGTGLYASRIPPRLSGPLGPPDRQSADHSHSYILL